MPKNSLRLVSNHKILVELLFEVRDVWIGLYWDVNYKENETFRYGDKWHLDIYFCLLPFFPLHIKYMTLANPIKN